MHSLLIKLLSIITAVLVFLKLMGLISASWWWVLAPMWVPAVIAFCLLVSLIAYIAKLEYEKYHK